MVISMSNQDVNQMLNIIQKFLDTYRNIINVIGALGGIRSRPQSAVYECYSLSELALQLKKAGWNVDLDNIQNGEFRFKISTMGDPNNFSYIVIEKNGSILEVRQQIRITSRWGSFTPDICIIHLNSLRFFNSSNLSLPNRYLENFVKCKHMEPYPMSCASFVGMLYVLNRWNRANLRTNRKFPAMIFYSNFSRSINVDNIIARFNSNMNKYANAIFDGIQPNSPRLADLQNYLKNYP